ncbi:MAG: cryptochrome/photolyase family protein [Pelagibacteraceae bacterium]|nr:cryptochrome/photolyase family protein [Pelagibacteraceae bacterium]|tara:strand:+ start:2277 stop:3758 length:1482 start_codon:yes stop_codon:yes gene_type:complete
MNALVLLGNQLFDNKFINKFKNSHLIYMAEDISLCTYVKHHKQKIYYFLASMREYRDLLNKKGYKLFYSELKDSVKTKSYFDNLLKFIKKNNIYEISVFEIEDKLFESNFLKFLNNNKIKCEFLNSPMFLTTRNEFQSLFKNKKPLMTTFYQYQRKKLAILMDNDKPLGGQWSFDKENRKRVPKEYESPRINTYKSKYFEEISNIIDKYFSNHFGIISKNSIFPFNRKDSLLELDFFLTTKLDNFGHYEDFIQDDQSPINHSLLSAPLNLGLITPYDITSSVDNIDIYKVGLNNLEGYVRQVIGWREFIRGVNQIYSENMLKSNFFKNNRSLTKDWYEGTTSIKIFDDLVNNLKKRGYSHHIPRLMVASNLMNLTGIKPIEVYKWFMTTYIDSSDWVMIPNVFGMGLYSDGGIFASKPYICGSNYLLKMSNYKKGVWADIVDGLYWNFIKKNENFFKKNPRLSMMSIALNRMSDSKLKAHITNAEKFINEYSN